MMKKYKSYTSLDLTNASLLSLESICRHHADTSALIQELTARLEFQERVICDMAAELDAEVLANG